MISYQSLNSSAGWNKGWQDTSQLQTITSKLEPNTKDWVELEPFLQHFLVLLQKIVSCEHLNSDGLQDEFVDHPFKNSWGCNLWSQSLLQHFFNFSHCCVSLTKAVVSVQNDVDCLVSCSAISWLKVWMDIQCLHLCHQSHLFPARPLPLRRGSELYMSHIWTSRPQYFVRGHFVALVVESKGKLW